MFSLSSRDDEGVIEDSVTKFDKDVIEDSVTKLDKVVIEDSFAKVDEGVTEDFEKVYEDSTIKVEDSLTKIDGVNHFMFYDSVIIVDDSMGVNSVELGKKSLPL